MSNIDLASHLIGGLTVAELNSVNGSPTLGVMNTTDFILDPTPNHLFTGWNL
jgi:arginine deiminase